jgi:glutamate-1-semialdehyde aminotransferase
MSITLPQHDESSPILSRSDGAYVFTEDGRRLVDLDNLKGSILLGHGDPEIAEAVATALRGRSGASTRVGRCVFSVAERLADRMQKEAVAFYRTGSAAAQAAVHALTTFRDRRIVLSAGYHGYESFWQSSATAWEPNDAGIVDFYYDLSGLEDLLRKYGSAIAGAIVAPDFHYLADDWYADAWRLLSSHGVPVVADEVRSGLRFSARSSVARFGWEPLMYVLSKGLANGLPLAAVVGDSKTLHAISRWRSTGWAEPTAFVAADVALRRLLGDGLCQRSLFDEGQRFIESSRLSFARHGLPIEVAGGGPMFQFVCATDSLQQRFERLAFESGLLLYNSGYQSTSVAFREQVVDEACAAMSNACTLLDRSREAGDDVPLSTETRLSVAWNVLHGLAPIASSPEQRQKAVESFR